MTQIAEEFEARFVAGGMPTEYCDYGVISRARGIEVCRVWREEDARLIASLMNTASTKEANLGSVSIAALKGEGDAPPAAKTQCGMCDLPLAKDGGCYNPYCCEPQKPSFTFKGEGRDGVIEEAQRLQDHMEQHHGVCLPASAWDAAIRALKATRHD